MSVHAGEGGSRLRESALHKTGPDTAERRGTTASKPVASVGSSGGLPTLSARARARARSRFAILANYCLVIRRPCRAPSRFAKFYPPRREWRSGHGARCLRRLRPPTSFSHRQNSRAIRLCDVSLFDILAKILLVRRLSRKIIRCRIQAKINELFTVSVNLIKFYYCA